MVIWYFGNYFNPYILFIFLEKIAQKTNNTLHFIQNMNLFMMADNIFTDDDSDDSNNSDIENKTNEIAKPIPKYEDKYLEEYRKMDKGLILDETEQVLKLQKYNDFFKEIADSYNLKIKELQKQLEVNNTKLDKYEGSDDDYCIYDGTDEDAYLGETKDARIQYLLDENNKIFIEIDDIKQKLQAKEGEIEISKSAEEKTNTFMIHDRLEKLKVCYVMEYTPLGNVLMIYDKERETFKYYSDNTIPYRYLEVVGRKYAKQFGCRRIFVDMEEQLKIAEEKWERERIEKADREEKERILKEEAIKNQKPIEQKKNVFAKFKSYNKEAGTGHVNTAPPPKNSIPNKLTEKQENEKILIKERANRYTYEGKFANFNFLKKVDRKVVDKKFALSFADFKKIQKMKTN
jgi:hypothetical protein